MISLQDKIPDSILPSLLVLHFDGEGHTVFEMFKYLNSIGVETKFDDEVNIYSIVNTKTGQRMSSPYRGETSEELLKDMMKHLLRII